MIETLAQIIAEPTGDKQGFCVGIVLQDDVVVEADGVVRYMRHWTRDCVRDYCKQRGWSVSVVWEMRRSAR